MANDDTVTFTGEPGVCLVFDKATGAASLPILAATTIGHMTDKDGKLGTVDWKALTVPVIARDRGVGEFACDLVSTSWTITVESST